MDGFQSFLDKYPDWLRLTVPSNPDSRQKTCIAFLEIIEGSKFEVGATTITTTAPRRRGGCGRAVLEQEFIDDLIFVKSGSLLYIQLKPGGIVGTGSALLDRYGLCVIVSRRRRNIAIFF